MREKPQADRRGHPAQDQQLIPHDQRRQND